MKKSIYFPSKYIQGSGVLADAGIYISMLGKKPVIIWGSRTRKAVEGVLSASMNAAGIDSVEVLFKGECTKEEAQRIADIVKNNNADVIMGIGGGKAIDTAKAVATLAKLPILIIPTIASNDAPTSACTVWYNDIGECTGFDFWSSNPNIVLVDTQIIVNAPIRTFIAGIGDALATWPEANAAYKSRAVSCAGGVQTLTSLSLAKLCFDTLLEFGLEAKSAVENKAVTPAVEKVVEATTLLSGIGWESGGLACAHAIANFLPVIHETHDFMHGEKVAFGLISQLCLEEDLKTSEIYEIVDFMIALGLPVTFEDLNMQEVSEERLMEFAKVAVEEGSFIHNHNFIVTAEDVYSAMLAADSLGKRRKALV